MSWGTRIVNLSGGFNEKMGAAHEKAIVAVGQNIRNQAKKHASGRPGPRVITNRLRGGIDIAIVKAGPDTSATIGDNVEYAAAIELGTSKRKSYPFLVPSVFDHIPEHRSLYTEIFEREME